jgi:hypothetical protein
MPAGYIPARNILTTHPYRFRIWVNVFDYTFEYALYCPNFVDGPLWLCAASG